MNKTVINVLFNYFQVCHHFNFLNLSRIFFFKTYFVIGYLNIDSPKFVGFGRISEKRCLGAPEGYLGSLGSLGALVGSEGEEGVNIFEIGSLY